MARPNCAIWFTSLPGMGKRDSSSIWRESIDSYGIGELVRSYLTIRQRGGELKLAGVGQKVLHVLTLTGLTKTFEIHADDAAALQSFGRKG